MGKFKMPGAPMIDTSKKHGTNKNYEKSGPPKFNWLDPLGLKKKIMGGGKNCPPAAAAPGTPPPPAATPAEPAAAPAAPAAAAPATPEEAAPTQMRKESGRKKVTRTGKGNKKTANELLAQIPKKYKK